MACQILHQQDHAYCSDACSLLSRSSDPVKPRVDSPLLGAFFAFFSSLLNGRVCYDVALFLIVIGLTGIGPLRF